MGTNPISTGRDIFIDDPNQNPNEISLADQALCQLLHLDADLQSLAQNICAGEWVEIARRGTKYQLTSLLYNRLKPTPAWAELPEDVRASLHQGHLQNTAAALALYHRIGQVLTGFARQDLPVVVLKGAFLGETVYSDVSERMMNDVDLLVPKTLTGPAIELLHSAGYRSSLDNPAQEDFPFHHHAPPFTQHGFPTIELHWELISPKKQFKIDLDSVWQRACPAMVAGVPVLGLAPEDLLLYLCIHTVNHHLKGGLRAIYDIAATSNHYAGLFDWDILIHQAGAWKAKRSAFLVLSLAKDMLGAPLPPGVLPALEPEDFNPEFLHLARRLVLFRGATMAPLPVHVVKLKNTKGMGGKIRLLLGRFFPPVTDIALHFGISHRSWRVWLYYPIRWQELFVRQSRLVWKLWRGDQSLLKRAQTDTSRLDLEESLSTWLAGESSGGSTTTGA
jgi:hypothetical protein